MKRKLAIFTILGGLTLSSIAYLSVAAAVDSKTVVTLPGPINCYSLQGHIRYSPPSRSGGTKPQTITIKLDYASDCTNGTPTEIVGKMVIHRATNNCPLGGVIGSGTMNLTNKGGLPPDGVSNVIAPSAMDPATVQPVGNLWQISGPVTGSFANPVSAFTPGAALVSFRPVNTRNTDNPCGYGIRQMTIARPDVAGGLQNW